MLAVVVEHKVKPGMMAAARTRIDTNSERIAQCDGLLMRLTSVPKDRPDWIVTITVWTDQDAIEAWNREKSSMPLQKASDLYEQVHKIVLPDCSHLGPTDFTNFIS